MAKPDDRSDNAEKLQKMIHDTEENLREARDYYKAHAQAIHEDTKQQIKEKNQRREEAIKGFRSEIKDETRDMR